jgi:hypothetical protein
MSGRGGNLSQPLKKVLINVPGPANLGTYRQAAGAIQMLQFKAHGYTIPVNANSTLRVTQPQPAVMRISTVQLSNVAPTDPNNYNYGITVVRKHRKAGVGNSNVFTHSVFYGGNRRVTAAGITNAELNAMRNDIITQINANNGYTQQFPNELPGSSVVATPVLHLDTWNAASAMTLDGNVVAAAATIALFVANINAVPGYFAWVNPAVPATEIFVIKTTRAVTPNVVSVFANTAGTIAAAVAQPNGFFALTQRYPEAQYEVQVVRNTGVHNFVRRGNYALLTNAEVQKIFSHIPNDGFLAQERRHPNLVLPDVDYVKINIDSPQQHYDLGGASHTVGFITAIEVYMPAAEWNIVAGQNVNRRWEVLANNRIMDAGTLTNVRDVIAATAITVI